MCEEKTDGHCSCRYTFLPINAENWQTKRQILSLFVNDCTKTELPQMMPGLSKWRIDQACCLPIDVGEGQPLPINPFFAHALILLRLIISLITYQGHAFCKMLPMEPEN